jgi:hypothetical protein
VQLLECLPTFFYISLPSFFNVFFVVPATPDIVSLNGVVPIEVIDSPLNGPLESVHNRISIPFDPNHCIIIIFLLHHFQKISFTNDSKLRCHTLPDPGSLFSDDDEAFFFLELFPFAFLGAALALGAALGLALDAGNGSTGELLLSLIT